MNEELRRDIILEHYQKNDNKKNITDPTYIKINNNNESCIDNIDLYLKLENDQIVDLKFDGEACVISTSTTSIMSELLVGKTTEEAQKIIDNYLNMIEEKPYNQDILKEANAFNEIYKQPSRKKCATLTWYGLSNYLKENRK